MGEKNFSICNPKDPNDGLILGKFDITKTLSVKERCQPRKVTFGKKIHMAYIFARIEEHIDGDQLDDAISDIEEQFHAESGSFQHKYFSVVLNFPGRILNGIKYINMGRDRTEKPVPLPQAKLSRDFSRLSTDPEEETHKKMFDENQKFLVNH